MARYLMDHCNNNRTDVCDPKVSYSRWPKELRDVGDIPLFPRGKKQEELDKICEACPHACFIAENNCPVCQNKLNKLGKPVKATLVSRIGSFAVYHYVCEF